MIFERALQFFKEDKVSQRESILFSHFRQVRIWPALKDILKYRNSAYSEVRQACSQSLPYMELISLLVELYEHKYTLKKADLESGSLEIFVSNELQKFMIPPVSDLFISEVSRNISLLLRKRI